MSHYYTDNTNLNHEFKYIEYKLNNYTFTFKTDKGVFSKDNVDFGTDILIKTLLKEDIIGKVLDMGCGYGVISITLNKILNLKMKGVDINPRAIELAIENSKLNTTNVEYLISSSFSNIHETFDNIVINPPIRTGKKVIYKMFNDSYDYLNQNGKLYIVIRKQQGSKSARKEIENKFKNCEVIETKKGYEILKAIKY